MSFAVHALMAALLAMTVTLSLSPPDLTVAAIKVVMVPPPPASPPAPASAASRWASSGSDPRPPADAERQAKGTPDARTIDGRGIDKVPTLAPKSGDKRRDGLNVKDAPNQALSIVPPLTLDTPWPDARPAAPGLEGAPWAREGAKQDDKQTTAQRHPIQCGPNATRIVRAEGRLRRGQVWRELNEREKDQARDISENGNDMFVSPGYLDHQSVFVSNEGRQTGSAVVVPSGMSVRIGDRIEFMSGHLDPARPCHFIPNLAIRVL